MDNKDLNTEQEVYDIESEKDSYNKKINAVPKPKTNIGIDEDDSFIEDVIKGQDRINLGKLESFSSAALDRDQTYLLLDSMAEDSIIAAALETYAEDATETNEEGHIIWVESDDDNVAKFVQYLLSNMEVDKYAYQWTKSLCKYGDVYFKLYRQSEITDSILDKEQEEENKILNEELDKADDTEDATKEPLNEAVKVKLFDKNDKYVHYIEAVPNPAEMFELTRFGKTYAYIKANLAFNQAKAKDTWLNSTFRYSFKQSDVVITNATSYVHACLMDDTSRLPETVDIFLPDTTKNADEMYSEEERLKTSYTVKRGQSILAPAFKVWRELMLLENALLLNRLTKSSILRVVSIEATDMPKEQAKRKLLNVKNMIEQKTAIDTNVGLKEYTNPGPIENNIYTITKNGQGAITTTQIGGDVDVKNIADLDYFKNRLFGTLRIPAQYLGETDDNTGFNGGTALSLISSRYAKEIKRIQNALVRAITDAINLMLIDKGLTTYINKFEIHMMPPTTQEEIDRRDNEQNKINMASDILSLTADIEDPVAKLKIMKQLLSNITHDTEIISIVQEEIDKMEEASNVTPNPNNTDFEDDLGDFSVGHNTTPIGGDNFDFGQEDQGDTSADFGDQGNEEASGDEQILPTPAELGVGDMSDNNNPEL